MANHLEFEEKSVEKAIQKACKKINIPKEELKYNVISYGSSGIFGLVGTKKARIRVVLPQASVKSHSNERGKAQNDREKKHISKENSPLPVLSPALGDGEKASISNDTIELGQSVLQRILDFITTDAKISIEKGSDQPKFNVTGGNTAALIGKHGQTLEAIQYLVEKIVNKRLQKRIRIQIDIEGYLEGRRAGLERLAVRLAEKAKREGKPVAINQMNAHDRRIVHLVLKDDEDVRTQSKGNGLTKKLLILPKKNVLEKKKQ